MGNFNEMIQFLIESVRTYTGSNPIWILYPAALLLIWFLGKKEDRKIFIGVLAAELLTIFNPFLMTVFLKLFDLSNRYLRFLWMLVYFLTIAYAVTLVIFKFSKIWCRLLAAAVCALLIAGLGIPVFFGEEVPAYTKTQNEYFMDSEILDLCNIIHSADPGIENPRLMSGGLILLYKQYDPSAQFAFTRKILQFAETRPEEEFMASESFSDEVKALAAVYYYHDFSEGCEEYRDHLLEYKIDYVISTSPELDEYFSGSEMCVVGETANCRVWKAA